VHIELTEMLRCPETHAEAFLVLSTGEMVGRMVRSGLLGCPVCGREYPIVNGVVQLSGAEPPEGRGADSSAPAPESAVDAPTLQALLDLSGPGGYVVLVGAAARHAIGLAGLMGGIHFVGVNAPQDAEELPILSLLSCRTMIPLRRAMARGVVLGGDRAGPPWCDEAQRVLLPGRRLVIEADRVTPPTGVVQRAVAEGLWVGEKR
jgi:uncharacterized protein YbaR (Trm112 family)